MATFWEKYRDPRWQRRRLEIMQRADFRCEDCDAADKTLNVHHALYRKGADPWDYTDDELLCLCESCHQIRHGWKARLDRALVDGYANVECVVGYAEGFALLYNHDAGNALSLALEGFEHASGVAAAFEIDVQQVIELWQIHLAVRGKAKGKPKLP